MLRQFLRTLRNYVILPMIGLEQVWGMMIPLLLLEYFQVIARNLAGDVQYHEADRYLKWLCSAHLTPSMICHFGVLMNMSLLSFKKWYYYGLSISALILNSVHSFSFNRSSDLIDQSNSLYHSIWLLRWLQYDNVIQLTGNLAFLMHTTDLVHRKTWLSPVNKP